LAFLAGTHAAHRGGARPGAGGSLHRPQDRHAFPRFEEVHGYDAFFYSAGAVPQVASLPEVASVTRLLVPAVGDPTCARRPISANDFSLDQVAPAHLTTLVKLVSGRLPQQSDPDQVLASYNLEPFGVHIGSVLRVPRQGGVPPQGRMTLSRRGA
jgi:hypothetical protein